VGDEVYSVLILVQFVGVSLAVGTCVYVFHKLRLRLLYPGGFLVGRSFLLLFKLVVVYYATWTVGISVSAEVTYSNFPQLSLFTAATWLTSIGVIWPSPGLINFLVWRRTIFCHSNPTPSKGTDQISESVTFPTLSESCTTVVSMSQQQTYKEEEY
jgi:hypothetical protein